MINKNDFDGGLIYGPAAFADITGRNKVWSASPGPVARRERPCPNCGGSERTFLWQTPDGKGLAGWDYHRCKCGMVYTVYAPIPEELERVYKLAPAQQEWVSLQQNVVELKLDRIKFQWALENISWPDGARSILDIGCSTGTLLEVAHSMEPRAALYGVEINEQAVRELHDRARARGMHSLTVSDSLEDYKSDQMDVVVLWEVLEHVLEPGAMLKQAWDILAPGGKLIICVPNMASLAVSVLHEKCPCFGLGHINMWAPTSLYDFIIKQCCDAKVLSMETIVSWHKEVANWMMLRGPMADDPETDCLEGLLPSANDIHRNQSGYKLVAFVEKPS